MVSATQGAKEATEFFFCKKGNYLMNGLIRGQQVHPIWSYEWCYLPRQDRTNVNLIIAQAAHQPL